MLEIMSSGGTPHKRVFPRFSNKENCFEANPAAYLVFMPNFDLYLKF